MHAFWWTMLLLSVLCLFWVLPYLHFWSSIVHQIMLDIFPSSSQSQYSWFRDPILNFMTPPDLLLSSSRAGCIHPQCVYFKAKNLHNTVGTIFVCLNSDNYEKCAVCPADTRCWLLQARPESGPAGSEINSVKQTTGPRESFTIDQAFITFWHRPLEVSN